MQTKRYGINSPEIGAECDCPDEVEAPREAFEFGALAEEPDDVEAEPDDCVNEVWSNVETDPTGGVKFPLFTGKGGVVVKNEFDEL